MTDSRRPNVLFIITDQQRADHAGFAGNTVVQTPALDGLAARGTVFDQAWVSNPVCMPNRSTIMTGRMPSTHGVIFNDRSLEWGANTHVRAFRTAGWKTGLIGKSHLQHGMSRDTVFPIDREGAVADPWPTAWDTLEHDERYSVDTEPKFPDSFYGFEHVEVSIDHGARISGHHLRWALDRGGDYEELTKPQGPEIAGTQRSDRWWQINKPTYGPELHSTSFVTERTISFIEDAARGDQPWLCWASFPDPHHPMTPPGEWFDRHDPADMELPATINDPMEGGPAYLRHLQHLPQSKQRNYVTPFGADDHELVKEAIAATYGMIEMVDDGVGKILAAVERLGMTDDTIVVFTSDHGDMMGDHGLMLKGFMHYRGTLQVPMVIVDPGRGPSRTSSLSGSIDLGPTLMELCDVPAYDGIQGTSLVPLLDDASSTVRDRVLIEDDIPEALAARSPIPQRTRTVVTKELKYTRHSTGEEQLFNLAADPDELTDLSGSNPALRADALTLLTDAMMSADEFARGTPLVPR